MRTVNLEVAHTRLQDILAEDDDEYASRSQQTHHVPPPTDEDVERENAEVYLERESRAAEWLHKNRVPLLYHPARIAAVHADPVRFEGVLRPFWRHPPLPYDAPATCFFERQGLRWLEFKRFQDGSRRLGIFTREALMRTDYEAALVRAAPDGATWKRAIARVADFDTPERWDEFRTARLEEAEYLRDEDAATMAEYRASVMARLARFGVEVELGGEKEEGEEREEGEVEEEGEEKEDEEEGPLPLLLEFWHQGTRTTWAEYVAFECWHMEAHDEEVALHQDDHDAAYALLQQVISLAPHETPAFLPTPAALTQRRVARDMAFARGDHLRLLRARQRQRGTPPALAARRARAESEEAFARDERTRFVALAELEDEIGDADAAIARVTAHEEAVAKFLRDTATFREVSESRDRQVCLLNWAKDRFAEMRADDGEGGRETRVAFDLPSDDEEAETMMAGEDTAHGEVALPVEQPGAAQTTPAEEPRTPVEASSRSESVLSSAPGILSSPAEAQMLVQAVPLPPSSPVPVAVQSPADHTSVHASPRPAPCPPPLPISPVAQPPSSPVAIVEKTPAGPSSPRPGPAPPSPPAAVQPPAAKEPSPAVAAAPASAPVPVLRRSARIAAKREKAAAAAEQAAAAQAAQVVQVKSSSAGGGGTRGKRKRGRGAEEDGTQDAPQPAKRPRRRAAKK